MATVSGASARGKANWRSFDCAQCTWTVVAENTYQRLGKVIHQEQGHQNTMHLTIHVSDAAYMDKTSSDILVYELIPKYFTGVPRRETSKLQTK